MSNIGGKSTYRAGDYNAISDIDGQKYKRSEMTLNWKNQLVNRQTEFEPKHPQLTIRPRQESIAVTDARTQASDSGLLDPPITTSQMV